MNMNGRNGNFLENEALNCNFTSKFVNVTHTQAYYQATEKTLRLLFIIIHGGND